MLRAGLGRARTSRFSAKTTVLFAVIPGRSLRSELSTSMTASYVTTFCVVVAELRIWLMVPLKRRPGKASTVKDASMPCSRRPTSPSETLVLTCIFRRS